MVTKTNQTLLTPLDRTRVLIEALPYIQDFSGATVIIKIGGSALINKELFKHFAEDVVLINSVGINPIVVHGGGPQIGEHLSAMGKQSSFINGLRVTDQETLAVVKEVLQGEVCSAIVGAINELGGKAIGISGEQNDLIQAEQRSEELGYVGDITGVSTEILDKAVHEGIIPVVTTIGADGKGQSYNINADTATGALAGALKVEKVIYLSDVPGLLADKETPESLISEISAEGINAMIKAGEISDGMIPKVNSCIDALAKGAHKAHLLDGRIPHVVLLELFTDSGIGTMIVGGK
ncbi:MAG: acetylglutamate kinase [Actinomycetota bacterium]|nr:acetylglutamate kinase [Actinomycetota bacterium]